VSGEGDIRYERFEGPIEAAADDLLALCKAVFDDFENAYLLDRLPHLSHPDLWIARREGALLGFKLAYRRGADLLYSWLGGVVPEARGKGVATELLRRQHAYARLASYGFIETRTRATNNPMILLNLKHGFHITGFDVDARNIPVVVQRKLLA
jgi:GNAT superfamily N-acetyltransferase